MASRGESLASGKRRSLSPGSSFGSAPLACNDSARVRFRPAYLKILNAGPTKTATVVPWSRLFQLALTPPARFESFITKK